MPLNQNISKSILTYGLSQHSSVGGFIVRDWTGKVIKVEAANYGHSSTLVAEARALTNGVQLAIQTGYNQITIEGNNLVAIQALQGTIQVPWQITTIIQDTHAWLQVVSQVMIKHIFQEANMSVDWLAKFGHLITDRFSTNFYFSSHLSKIVAENIIGRTFVRKDV